MHMRGKVGVKVKRQRAFLEKHSSDDMHVLLDTYYKKFGTVKDAAEYLGIPTSTYWSWMSEFGVKRRPVPTTLDHVSNSAAESLLKAGHTYKQTAEKLGVSISFIAAIAKGTRRDPGTRQARIKKKHGGKCVICGKPKYANRWYCKRCHTELTEAHDCNGGMSNAAYNL